MAEQIVTPNLSQHTPGPWVLHIDGLAVFGALHGLTRQQVIDAEVSSANIPMAERKANARLIAAAPDLLAALKALAHEAVWDDDSDREAFDAAYAQATAAIAKAEGR